MCVNKELNKQYLSVFAGTLPNITRNALVNCTELVTYDLIKEAILKHNLLSGERHACAVS